ncbi:hypothetical protein AVEN_77355-1 [Araneus ventricosus]|uniref:DUF4817 domain-containing protein n=1 Tax=Araneus ventricosus TaxID=182803 RepID=A0A4Y2CB29_ARAVE|nr:hypothetical protein AVEN_77355-1 [Araneus ventricosus]
MRTTRLTCYKNTGYTAFLPFVSEKFAMTVSLKDCSLLVKLFYKNNDCAPVALQKFPTLKVEEVATAVQEESSGGVLPCSAREISRALDRPVSTVHKILRNILHCYPYKISHVQELFPSDLPARETFALEFLARMELDNEWPWKILWTDEAYFHLTGYVNTQNCRIWATENPLETLYHFILQRSLCGASLRRHLS